jgi:hypothetical protein
LKHFKKDWDYFFILANIPRYLKGDIHLSTKESTLHTAGARKEDVMGKRKGK